MATSRIGPNDDSGRALNRAVDRSRRSSGIQLPIDFARRTTYSTQPAPLAQILRGGRGGEVRLKLYLSMMLVATRKPFQLLGMPARVWAVMLSLPDPDDLGARRVSDALKWLNDHDFLVLDRHGGSPPDVTLRSPTGSGAKYVRPTKRWITLPLGFWKYQWINALSGRATAILIAVLDMQGGRAATNPPWLSAADRSRYSLSADTWARGTRELVEAGLVSVKRVPQGRSFDWRRLRNTYWVDVTCLEQPAPQFIRAADSDS